MSRGDNVGLHNAADIVTLNASDFAAGKLVVPLGGSLLTAEFQRSGTTLELRGDDGMLVRIEDYFCHDEVADLWTPGGAMIPGALVERLSGPAGDGWAQVGAGAGRSIGVVEQVIGTVQVERADGTTETLSEGSAVFQGDIVTTGAGAGLGIRFADETVFAMEGNGRMVLDELVYDPSSQAGLASVSILQGAFLVVTGQIAKTDPDSFVVKTPVATIGVRGTLFSAIQGEQLDVFFDDGRGFVFNLAGRQNIEAGQNLTVAAADQLPGAPQATPEGEFDQIFALSLGIIPITPFMPQERRDGQPPGQPQGQLEGDNGQITTADDSTLFVVADEAIDDLIEATSVDQVLDIEQSEPSLLTIALDPTPIIVTPIAYKVGSLAYNAVIEGIVGDVDDTGLTTTGTTAEPIAADQNSGVVIGPDRTPIVFTGTDLPENVAGGFGPDTLDGGGGNDSLSGLGGDDVIDGGSGFDVVSYRGSGASVNVDLATGVAQDGEGGTDTLSNIEAIEGSDFDDTLTGDAGANLIEGGDGTDLLTGNAGDDMLAGGAGDDTLDGGAGTDLASYQNDPTGVTASLATGTVTDRFGNTDTLVGIENLRGSNFGDRLTGDASGNLIEGGDGSDLLAGNAGDDTLDGGARFDVVSYRGSGASVNVDLATGVAQDGEGGTDTLRNIEAVEGSDFDDTLTGDAGANLIEGGDGDDLLTGNAGDDTLDGDAGFDVVSYRGSGASVNVDLATGVAQDSEGGTDTLRNIEAVEGSDFDDTLTGDAGANLIEGGDGDDLLTGNAGDDTLDGGAGFDVVSYRGSGASVNVDLATGVAQDGEGGTDTLSNIEAVEGSDFDDTLTGDAGANLIEGGDGDDLLIGNAGDDTLDGDAGFDVVSYRGSGASVNVDLATGVAQDSEGGTDTLRNIGSC